MNENRRNKLTEPLVSYDIDEISRKWNRRDVQSDDDSEQNNLK